MFEVDFHILNQKATPAIYADILAARPAAGFVGRLFVATDSPYGVFRDTGSAWVQVASNGGGGGGSTGVNGLNGTTNIGLGGNLDNNTTIFGVSKFFSIVNTSQTLFDTQNTSGKTSRIQITPSQLNFINNNTTSSFQSIIRIENEQIKTLLNASVYGLFIDFNNQKTGIGDVNFTIGKKNSIQVDDNLSKIYFTTSRSSSNTVADLFYAENVSSSVRSVKIGDFGNFNNGASLIVDDGFPQISTNIGGINIGFKIDISESFFGQTDTNYCGLRINGSSQDVGFRTFGNVANGLFFNFITGIYNFGDRLVNNTAIQINDPAKQISFTTDNLIYTGVALEDPIPGVVATKALLINLNGTVYKINLY